MQQIKAVIKRSLNRLGLDIKRLSSTPDQCVDSKLAWLKHSNINTVIDVGANAGQFANNIHDVLSEATIISFEPLAAVYKQLLDNTKDVPSLTAINCALGADNTQMEIRHNDFSPSSSFLEMTNLHRVNFPFTAQDTPEAVSIRRLDDVLAGMTLKDDILLKIDVQGYEDQVLLGADKTLPRIKLIFIEVSFRMLYTQQPLFDDTYSYLKQKGFKYIGNLEQLHSPIDGSILQADAIFERSNQ